MIVNSVNVRRVTFTLHVILCFTFVFNLSASRSDIASVSSQPFVQNATLCNTSFSTTDRTNVQTNSDEQEDQFVWNTVRYKSGVSRIISDFNVTENGSVSISNVAVYNYQYYFTPNQTWAIRINVVSPDAERYFPLLLVIRQERSILSWQIPLILDNHYRYDTVSHTLCPLQNYYDANNTTQIPAGNQSLDVELSTHSKNEVHYSLTATEISNFVLRTYEVMKVLVTPSEPSYFEYHFPKDHDIVFVLITSPDKKCMTVSIQDIRCPIFDLDRNIQFRGIYQTVSTQTGINIRKSDFPAGKFYIVLLLKTTDYDCAGIETIVPSGINHREKEVSIQVTLKLTRTEYYEATFGAIGFFLSFFVFSITISAVYCMKNQQGLPETSLLERTSDLRNSLAPQNMRNYGSISTSSDHNMSPCFKSQVNESGDHATVSSICTSSTSDSDSALDETDIDMLSDAEEEKDVFRTKTFLFVADLARKKEKTLSKNTKLYTINLLTIGIFYGVPVVQLVLTYEKVLHETGNEDICYYNFLCSHSLGVFSDFNHVFSNIGYVLLGFLFLGLVWRRDLLHQKAMALNDRAEKFFGIPRHFGLFYAMGFALMMEGLLSACYHVCPNSSNFQFDTAFMYIIASLCMLKIYQARHPDINAKAHAACLTFAIVVFIGVVGVLKGVTVFWIAFVVFHILSCIALSAQIYYMGRWKLNIGIFKRIYLTLRNDLYKHFTRPMYMDRLFLLLIANAVNWSLSIYGLIKRPRDFGSHLLAIFITNLLLYVAFYIIMKIRHKERILCLPITYILLSIITWGAALYFFMQKNTSWQVTPAQSRELNMECRILHFYDDHDIWHFLSSSALFFSFMILLTLDDDLIYTPRDKIPVF